MIYWAGYKNGKLVDQPVWCTDGDFYQPALYTSKKDAERQMKANKEFNEIRKVEIKELGTHVP